MKTFILCAILALTAAGCSSNPSHTYRGDVLDDKVTEQRVQAALNRAGPDFKAIQAQATNGVVVLSGTVNTPEARTRAEEIARGVHRVTRLENDVQVRQ
jgi:osmotically-inducible protein OsmY